MRWYSIVPLSYVPSIDGAPIQFGGRLEFANVPQWLLEDQLAQRISAVELESVSAAKHAFVAEYEAASLGDIDPTWEGSPRRSIQEAKYELAVLANFALWLAKPSPACFSVAFHAPQYEGVWSVQQTRNYSPLLCTRRNVGVRISRDDVERAAKLHVELVNIARGNSVWTAIRSAWQGLTIAAFDIRYLLFWIALEALFGPDDAREMTFRLSQRIGFFLASERSAAKSIFASAKKCYGTRSQVAHGRWKSDSKADQQMETTEDLLRQSLSRLLEDPSLIAEFAGADRERYLDEIVFGDNP